MNQNLFQVTKMFGYRVPKDFITKHFKIMLAMLTPICIKSPLCKDICQDICRILQRDPEEAFSKSFLTIFPYIYMNFNQDMYNRCIDFIMKITSNTLYNLLFSDIKVRISNFHL